MKTTVTIMDPSRPQTVTIPCARVQSALNLAEAAIAMDYHAIVESRSSFSVVLERVDSRDATEVEVADWETLEAAFPELPTHALRSGDVIVVAEGAEEVSYCAYERR